MRIARWTIALTSAAVAFGMSGAAASVPAAYVTARSSPQQDPYYPAEGGGSVDALHYSLHLHWHRETRKLVGKATVLFRVPRDESRFRLDLSHRLHVRSARLDGSRVTFSRAGDRLVFAPGPLQLGDVHRIRIRYAGRPRPVTAPTRRSDFSTVGWTTTTDGEVWTMQEPFGAFTWYPVNDQPADKAFYDITATTNAGWHTVANGRLVSNRATAKHRTMHWRLAAPAASYLVTIAIGPYHRYRDTGPHGLPLTYWLRPTDKNYLHALRRSPSILRWLEQRLGPFPFNRAGAMVVPSGSAMETQTMLTMGETGRRGFASTLAHEYAHQWYGDIVTPNNWKDLWMNEAFAMYLQLRYEVKQGLWPSWRSVRRSLESDDQLLRDQYGPPGAYDPKDFAESNVYICGALMLDRLRTKIGAHDFRHVLRAWPQRHVDASVDRHDWVHWLDARTGRDLRHFVHTWLTSGTTPS